MHAIFLALCPAVAQLLAGLVPACACPTQEPQLNPALEIGAPVPPLSLTDLDGKVHDLAKLEGSIVVLEWTCHVCPSVAAQHESRMLDDARAAVDPARVRWLQIDSSWFAPLLAADVRAWRARLGLDVPYLLDTDGAAARAFGARGTPHVFVVDAAGKLAYEGAPDDGAWEPERRNHVVDAVRALLAGGTVAVPRTRVVGCGLKLAQGEPRTSVDPAAIQDDVPAKAAYALAADAARAGRAEPALAELRRALELGLPEPWRAVADPAFRELLLDAASRRALAELLGRHPPRGRLTMVAPDEPGEAFVLCGTVRDERGQPMRDVLVELYHTDDAGWYSPGSTRGENPRLFGRVRTDRAGRYRVRTVLPAPYATGPGGVLEPDGAIHVHMAFRAEGYRMPQGRRASLFFADDPRLAGATRKEIEGDGNAILPRTRNAEGTVLCVYDLELRKA